MRNRATAITVALAVGFVVLAGCSGKKEKATPPTTTRFPPTVPVTNQDLSEGSGVCGLLTQSEVSSNVGIASQRGSGSRAATNEACRWTLQGTNQFVLLLSSTGDPAIFDRSRGGESEDLPGLADKAFVLRDTAYALKGNKVLILQVATSQTIAQRKEAAIKLMRAAAPRL